MTFINNVSQKSGNKTQFISSIYFHFTQKSKQAFYSLKNLPKKTLPQVLFFGFFKIFHFLRYLKAFYINYINSNSFTEHITL